MKNKLKYLLIIGTTLSATPGATEVENLGFERTEKTLTHATRISLSATQSNTRSSLSTQVLTQHIGQRIKKLSQDIKTLHQNALGYAEILASPYGAILDKPLQLSTKHQEALLERDRLKSEKAYFVANRKSLQQNTLTKEDQQMLEMRLYRKATAVVDTTSGRWQESAYLLESLKRYAAQNRFLTATSCLEELANHADENRLLRNALQKRSTKALTSSTELLTEKYTDLVKKAINHRLIQEAQHNCLGIVTALSHDVSDGNSPVIMTPSTKRPSQPAPERSPAMSGNISPVSTTIDHMPSSSFMLPPPMIAVPSRANDEHTTPSTASSVRSATPYPSRAESCDSLRPRPSTLSTPLPWSTIEKIRI